MARKLSISKSNYFKINCLNTLDLFDTKDQEKYTKVLLFFTDVIFSLLEKDKNFLETNFFRNFIEDPKVEDLKNKEKDKTHISIKNGEYQILKLSTILFYYTIGKLIKGDSINKIYKDEPSREIIYNYYQEHFQYKILDYLNPLMPILRQPTKEFISEVLLLIEGYGTYLDEIKEKTKRKVCENIEKELKLSNVRQDYDGYDNYFTDLENYVNIKYNKDFRVSYLKACAKPWIT